MNQKSCIQKVYDTVFTFFLFKNTLVSLEKNYIVHNGQTERLQIILKIVYHIAGVEYVKSNYTDEKIMWKDFSCFFTLVNQTVRFIHPHQPYSMLFPAVCKCHSPHYSLADGHW